MKKLLVALFAIALLTACQSGWNVRQPETQVSTAVKVGSMCGIGSGTLLDSKRVLTAAHVVTGSRCFMLMVKLSNGETHAARITKLDEANDLAIITMLEATKAPRPYTVGAKPKLGHRVCASISYPRPRRRCGTVEMMRGNSAGDFEVDSVYDFGNSGSGVYNERGQLVGVVSHLSMCSNRQFCSGGISSLEGREELFKE